MKEQKLHSRKDGEIDPGCTLSRRQIMTQATAIATLTIPMMTLNSDAQVHLPQPFLREETPVDVAAKVLQDRRDDYRRIVKEYVRLENTFGVCSNEAESYSNQYEQAARDAVERAEEALSATPSRTVLDVLRKISLLVEPCAEEEHLEAVKDEANEFLAKWEEYQ